MLLDADYTARLTDFGLVSSIAATSEGSTYLRMSTMRPGSLRWIAPEQVLCDSKERFRKTKKSDIYSFGNTALQARPHGTNVWAVSDSPQVLSGKQPWSEIYEDTTVVLWLAQGRKPARPKSRPLDDQHWEFINICWSPIQEHRPTSRCIVSAIEQFLDQYSPPQSIRDLIAFLSRRGRPRCVRRVSALDGWEHNGMRNAGENGDCHGSEGIEEDIRAAPRLRGSTRLCLSGRSVILLSAVVFQSMRCGEETDPVTSLSISRCIHPTKKT